jgi:hypothetical protein
MRMPHLLVAILVAGAIVLAPVAAAFAPVHVMSAEAPQTSQTETEVADVQSKMDCHRSSEADEPLPHATTQPDDACPHCADGNGCSVDCLTKCFQTPALVAATATLGYRRPALLRIRLDQSYAERSLRPPPRPPRA